MPSASRVNFAKTCRDVLLVLMKRSELKRFNLYSSLTFDLLHSIASL